MCLLLVNVPAVARRMCRESSEMPQDTGNVPAQRPLRKAPNASRPLQGVKPCTSAVHPLPGPRWAATCRCCHLTCCWLAAGALSPCTRHIETADLVHCPPPPMPAPSAHRQVTGGDGRQIGLWLAVWLAGVRHVQVWQPGLLLQPASCQVGSAGRPGIVHKLGHLAGFSMCTSSEPGSPEPAPSACKQAVHTDMQGSAPPKPDSSLASPRPQHWVLR